ncbi:diguanylate cyclase domain-containing protein [Halomonas sp. GD1P12]|uniref:diguanylate cyclase domain-containing protein n=1 Tax=Halomonas sp. GD1P12 TaxID=2982691 RepID=UPI0021E39995|nr:diguanylate cyclase [Halomonas sp. GD1P12]UYG01321.1 diguanylate cyclase [Halomonas sp. GD1P12]
MTRYLHPRALMSLTYVACLLITACYTLWLYAMGYYRELMVPLFITLLLITAVLLHCGRALSPYGPRAILLASAYIGVSSAFYFGLAHSLLWLGLPVAAAFVLLPHWSALCLNLLYTPLWWLIPPVESDFFPLSFGYLAIILMFALPPWELARRHALLRASDPHDNECDAYDIDTLKERLSNEFQRARLLDKRLAVLVLHLPQLDMAEEQFGLRTKKALLEALCSEVNRRCRDHDLLGRLGGANFWLVLPDTSESGALLVRERLYRALSRRVLIETGPLEARIGVCLPRPDERFTPFILRLERLSETLHRH